MSLASARSSSARNPSWCTEMLSRSRQGQKKYPEIKWPRNEALPWLNRSDPAFAWLLSWEEGGVLGAGVWGAVGCDGVFWSGVGWGGWDAVWWGGLGLAWGGWVDVMCW